MCLAHLAPQALEEFLAGLGPGSYIDARGTTIYPDLLDRLLDAVKDGDSKRVLGQASFHHARFEGGAGFDGAHFENRAAFSGAHIKGHARFCDARFDYGALFNDVHFEGGAWFQGAHFKLAAVFGDSYFKDVAWFYGTHFEGPAGFYSTHFEDSAEFPCARFSGSSSFSITATGQVNLQRGAAGHLGAPWEGAEAGGRVHPSAWGVWGRGHRRGGHAPGQAARLG
ncbi:hypothetical protein GCM10009800_46840 [Nocardiopsis rhodophaea]